MSDVSTIRHRVSLALRLIDTTTGGAVGRGPVTVLRNGSPIRPIDKGGGYLLFLGEEPEEYRLSVQAEGYEAQEILVRPEELDPVEPLLEFALVPDGGTWYPQPCRTLRGELPGLTALDAVRVGDAACFIRAFDARKKVVQMFNPNHLEMSGIHYAVVDPAAGSYERFTVLERISDSEIRIDRVLEREFDNNFPIARVVLGLCREDGRYHLRVRDDRRENRWLVRFVSGGREAFVRADMNAPDLAQIPGAKGGG